MSEFSLRFKNSDVLIDANDEKEVKKQYENFKKLFPIVSGFRDFINYAVKYNPNLRIIMKSMKVAKKVYDSNKTFYIAD